MNRVSNLSRGSNSLNSALEEIDDYRAPPPHALLHQNMLYIYIYNVLQTFFKLTDLFYGYILADIHSLEEISHLNSFYHMLYSYLCVLNKSLLLLDALFEPRLKFEMRLKYGWLHLKVRSIKTGF